MLTKYIFRRWPRLVAFLAIAILGPVVQSVSAYRSASMMDAAVAGAYGEFFQHLLVVFALFLTHGLCLFLNQAIQASVVRSAREDLKRDMFRDVMNTNNAFFSVPDVGYYIAAFSNDISMLEYRYFEAWMEAIAGVIALVTVSVAVVNISGPLAALIIGCQVLSLVMCLLVRSYSSRMNNIYLEKLSTFTQRIKDYFSAFQVIRNFSVEAQIKRKFDGLNRDTERAKNDADMSLAFVDSLIRICNSLTKFLVVGYGVVLMIQGDMTIGLVYAAYQFHDQMVSPMHTLISKSNSIGSMRGIVRRIGKITQACRQEAQQKRDEIAPPAPIALQDVSLTLGGREVLSHISFTFQPGRKYLIIGKNGAGKSQLLQLLKRGQEHYTGTITVAGRDIRELSFGSLSRVVSYINESVSLFCDSVRNNITLYRDVSDAELDEAVRTVGLNVPLERVVRDGERNLSSGETRRIEIARSLLRKAQVIIFDEAISTLDIPTAYAIEKTLLALPEQTILFVSHNFSGKLLDRYDEILLVGDGRILESGTHAELLQKSAYYRRLMSIKNGDETLEALVK